MSRQNRALKVMSAHSCLHIPSAHENARFAQGAPNIRKLLPAANAIVDYRALGSPAALRLELQRLNGDARAWEAKVGGKTPAWS